MALNSNPRRAGPFTGNGVTTAFSFSFKVLAEGDLRVVTRASTSQFFSGVDPADYTVSGVGDDSGGSITLATPLADQHELVILGAASYDQPLTLFNQGPYFAEDVMRALDRGVVLTQQLKEQIDRAFVLPESEVDGFDPLAIVLDAVERAEAAATTAETSEAAAVDTLAAITSKITVSSAPPSGGNEGDLWFQYED